MMSEPVDPKKLNVMYAALRKDELRNEKTGVYDDKAMVDRIAKYLLKHAKEEVEGK